MIRQGLQINVVPVPGTADIYSVSVYSQGYEDGQIAVTRHLLVAPLPRELENAKPDDFNGWVEDATTFSYHAILSTLAQVDMRTLSASYAQAEDAEDNASHRM